jgi:hypothetical protein
MRSNVLVGVLLALSLAGCEDRRKKAIEKVDHDQEVLRRAGAAVNEVVRNAPDCEAAKPLLAEAHRQIEEARRQVSVPASRQTLDVLEVQVDRVAEVCP